jgi:hypothetical protein
LKSLSGSGRLAPWEKVSFTLSLWALPTAMIPSRDHTGLPIHFHSSMISRSASRMLLRMLASVLPRQSVSSCDQLVNTFRWIHWISMPPNSCPVSCEQFYWVTGCTASCWADLFEISRRRTWPFHIQIPKGALQERRQTEHGGVLWKFFKRTINITEYRNAKDDVNPAKIERLVASFRADSMGFSSFCNCFAIHLDSRLLSRLRRPVGRFHTELLGVLRVQPLPAAELHRLGPTMRPMGVPLRR